ncbi:hypothetical protein EVAR_92690_1 [Eumeta japonica]|uniref:Uncharacterized protein n=1 Tax=Eumeta variegata TaxID=151549 RepID=A0A4C1SX43_EUMVA|nr:hypothetical protein EVAR_92690_1 [Eumeta japonica]
MCHVHAIIGFLSERTTRRLGLDLEIGLASRAPPSAPAPPAGSSLIPGNYIMNESRSSRNGREADGAGARPSPVNNSGSRAPALARSEYGIGT